MSINLIEIKSKVLLAVAIATLSGCAIRSEPAQLTMPLPEHWSEAGATAAQPEPDWWQSFDSDELGSLIAIALQESPDMAIAIERIRQAEATVRSAGSSLFPSLNLDASSGRRRTTPDGGATSISDSTSVGLGVSYEVDLWGRLSAGQRAAEAVLDSSRYDRETARLTLTTGVANGYFQVLATRARLQVARDNLAIAERLMRIIDVRYRNGAASALDVSQQTTAVLVTRAALPPLEAQERQALSALAILLGRQPQGFTLADKNITDLAVPEIGAGLPSELLMRRPDLASAEAQLRAADADLDAARAALLPSMQLAGSGGLTTGDLLGLSAPIRSVGISGSLAQSIFDGGRLRSQVASSESQRRQLLETYRAAILAALKEVEDALSNANRYYQQEIDQTAVRDEARRTLRLAELRLREGAAEMSTVLEAQRALYSSEDQLAQLRLSRLSSAIDVIKAAGGGWQRGADLSTNVSANRDATTTAEQTR
ncbi:MAG TPA: efflux transporter outer membrane subunit [Spongiibacteraceae bacterium]|nr:efflux transporter outer membrane subunit [Spongiibacteraceae bacterium]